MNNNIYNCFLTYLSDNSHALDRGNNYYIMLRYSLNCNLNFIARGYSNKTYLHYPWKSKLRVYANHFWIV